MFDRKEIREDLISLLKKLHYKQVIVEGKRDKQALCFFDFNKIITLNKGIHKAVENLDEKEVLILTDYDRAGKKLAKELNLLLQSLDCKIDRENRRKIGLLFSRLRIKKIEELRGVLKWEN